MPCCELGDISQPYFVETRPFEVGECELEDPEGLLEVEVVPKELSVFQQHKGSETTVLLASLKRCLYLPEGTKVDLKVDVKLP